MSADRDGIDDHRTLANDDTTDKNTSHTHNAVAIFSHASIYHLERTVAALPSVSDVRVGFVNVRRAGAANVPTGFHSAIPSLRITYDNLQCSYETLLTTVLDTAERYGGITVDVVPPSPLLIIWYAAIADCLIAQDFLRTRHQQPSLSHIPVAVVPLCEWIDGGSALQRTLDRADQHIRHGGITHVNTAQFAFVEMPVTTFSTATTTANTPASSSSSSPTSSNSSTSTLSPISLPPHSPSPSSARFSFASFTSATPRHLFPSHPANHLPRSFSPAVFITDDSRVQLSYDNDFTDQPIIFDEESSLLEAYTSLPSLSCHSHSGIDAGASIVDGRRSCITRRALPCFFDCGASNQCRFDLSLLNDLRLQMCADLD